MTSDPLDKEAWQACHQAWPVPASPVNGPDTLGIRFSPEKDEEQDEPKKAAK